MASKSLEKIFLMATLSSILLLLTFNHVWCVEASSQKIDAKGKIKLPTLGVGVLDIKTPEEQENALVLALDAGYRMIDIWEGDENVLRNAITRTRVPRSEIFIVVKLNPPETMESLYDTGDAVTKILKRLETSYIDLLLMNYADFDNQHVRRWRAMISLKNRQKAKLIGVSNFNLEQVLSLGKATAVLPSVVQLEINPFFQQKDLVKNLTTMGLAIQAYSPLVNGQKLDNPQLLKIAEKYDSSTAQLLIQWCIQKGYSCVTKSTNKMHLEDNINLGAFFIEDDDIKVLDSLEEGYVTNYDPNDPRFYEKSFYQAREEDPQAKKGRRGDDLDETTTTEEPYHFEGDEGDSSSMEETVGDNVMQEEDQSNLTKDEAKQTMQDAASPSQLLKGDTGEIPEESHSLKGKIGMTRDEF